MLQLKNTRNVANHKDSMSIYESLCAPKSKRIFLQPKAISRHLYCKMCAQVFEQPNRLQCGHTFCFVCINTYRILSLKCPTCKHFSKRQLQKDYIAFNLVDQLMVRCAHDGCPWTGQYTLCKNHQRNCEHKPKKADFILKQNAQEVDLQNDSSDKTTTYKVLPKYRRMCNLHGSRSRHQNSVISVEQDVLLPIQRGAEPTEGLTPTVCRIIRFGINDI